MNHLDQGFPEPLQSVMNHAARLAAALARLEMMGGPVEATPGLGLDSVWIVGRAEEVEVLVADVACDWQTERLSAKSAAVVIECYVQRLHREMAARGFGAPRCCSGSALGNATVDLGSMGDDPCPTPRRLPAAPPTAMGRPVSRKDPSAAA